MNVSSLPSVSGGNPLARTAAAISTAQSRFDDAASQVVADTMTDADAAPASGDLAGDLVSMKSEQITNSILYSLFRRQSEQQQDMLKAITPSNGA
jgi:hypothetical protein